MDGWMDGRMDGYYGYINILMMDEWTNARNILNRIYPPVHALFHTNFNPILWASV